MIGPAEHRRMPWKNGGGETIEIAVAPEGAGLDDFDWRVSMARVARPGPFSSFAGVDRTLAVLDGAGLRLDVTGRHPVELTAASPPCSFPADLPTTAALADGPVLDLNVMTRRDKVEHALDRLTVATPRELRLDCATALLFCRAGHLEVAAAFEAMPLAAGETLLLDPCPQTPLRLTPTAVAILFVVRLRPARP
ncbi:MAG: HutD family protein [Geminicoccaceae bacterium]